MTARTALIIHGHFYQPPREDPWMEEIEGEASAAPFPNWNERIHSECYRPNANSRILGQYGRIRSIVNNYTRLSFNFGPTLLSWMERFDPETLAAIVNADQESRHRHRGHGNAIAQAYNHMIMPLADERDRETQIEWGLADFRLRFGREPESMWMPETAVDDATLALMVEHGMKYVILSPFQCAEIEASDGKMQKVADGKFDTGRAYYISTSAGKLPVFFYHGALASDISFGHLLRSAEKFSHRLQEISREQTLITVATDGEVYGHHEPFGDMCCAYALHELFSPQTELGQKFNITNYGAYLAHNAPTLEAKLRPGASSWSCAHGVERWRANCGCRIDTRGVPSQAWRAPLRDALDQLRDALRKTFEVEGKKVMKDPYAARNDYIRVILSQYAPSVRAEFASRWFKRGADASVAWRLLESQRNAMLMFTSCGWFFDELSGIEPRQVMLYAGRAIDAAGPVLPDGVEAVFMKKLKEGKSNLADMADGAKIYRTMIASRQTAKLRVLNHAVLASSTGLKAHASTRYAVNFENEAFWHGGNGRPRTRDLATGGTGEPSRPEHMGRGLALVRDLRTESTVRYAWVARFQPGAAETLFFEAGTSVRWPGGDPRGKSWEEIRPLVGKRRDSVRMGLQHLFRSEARILLDEESGRVERDLEVYLRGAIGELEELLDQAAAIALTPRPGLSDLLGVMANFLWACHFRAGRYEAARALESRVRALGVTVAKAPLSAEVSTEMDRLAAGLARESAGSPAFTAFLAKLRAAQELEVKVDARTAQEVIYRLLKGEGRALIGAIVAGKAAEQYEILLALLEAGERLYLDVSEERQLLGPFEKNLSEDPGYWP